MQSVGFWAHRCSNAGTYDYRALPLPGSTVQQDHSQIASWTYDPQKQELISFDDPPTALAKASWILDQGLAGAMYWELSGEPPFVEALPPQND